MYEDFSADYDRFVDWAGRLRFELPFLEAQLSSAGAGEGARVLDAACGTGQHVLALVGRGFAAAGADLSPAMIEKARQNAAQAGRWARFEAAGFGELAQTFGQYSFNALLCLGNSLPHLLSPGALQEALLDFSRVLAPGGLLILQNRNFDAVMRTRQRWMEPQAQREGAREWLFLRFYDFEADGLITFNILSLRREGDAPWTQQVHTTRLRPLLWDELVAALEAAGFDGVERFGSLGGEAFDPASSGNLVIKAWNGIRS
ncbi:MAG TPA: class I SAM-dependent methyltransferase [Anaerolineales bacterium]|nr:class I SAM-dependent methyltransferase [Anaerolineales bacterium]